jgi:HAD superfamily hydrolase (TIGR01484 family)
MHFAALATDYDGTLARDGVVDPKVVDALRRFRLSGRQLILVTGRTMESLIHAFPNVAEFDLIVAENGAMLYGPDQQPMKALAEALPAGFTSALKERGIIPLEVGRVIVATTLDYKDRVAQVILDLGFRLQIVLNRGSVMILPLGVNKACGLKAAVEELGLSIQDVAGIGDAENDHAFLSACEFSAAVGNALPELKQRVQLVTRGECGAGVIEFIDRIISDDLNHRRDLKQP